MREPRPSNQQPRRVFDTVKALALTALLAATLLTCCSKPRATEASAAGTASVETVAASSVQASQRSAHVTEVTMHNVILDERPGFQLRVRWLRAQMRPTRPDVVPSFDQPDSFFLNIQDGVIATKLAEISAAEARAQKPVAAE